jgi:hypothetical protein
MNALTSLNPQDLDQLARKRAGSKLGWYSHAMVYTLVNVGLFLLASAAGRHWNLFPLLGWGLALLVHAAIVFIIPQEGGLHARLVQRERNRLQALRDPW